jgi:hypothetical protein
MLVDPLAADYAAWSPYNYVMGNPIINIDPDGRSVESTIVEENEDGTYSVVSVDTEDGDTGIYVGSKEGQKIGETEYIDEFVDPNTNEAYSNYIIDPSLSYNDVIRDLVNTEAIDMDLIEVAKGSAPGGVFDVKSKKEYARRGGLLNGKYVTARSAGNYLAGFNAARARYMGAGIAFDKFQKMAGALHQMQRFDRDEMISIYLTNKPYNNASPPEYGEIPYQYRQSKRGYDAGRNSLVKTIFGLKARKID